MKKRSGIVRHNAHGRPGPSSPGALSQLPTSRLGTLTVQAGMQVAPTPAAPYQARKARAYGDWSETLAAYAPGVQTLVTAYTDPHKRLEKARAKLQNAIDKGAPESRLRLLRAEVTAAEEAVRQKEATLESGQKWQSGITRNLWALTAVGGGLVLVLGAVAYRQIRASRRRGGP